MNGYTSPRKNLQPVKCTFHRWQSLSCKFICVQFNNLKPSSIIAPVCLGLKHSLLTKVAMNVCNTHHLSTRILGVFSHSCSNSYDIKTVPQNSKAHRAAQLKWSLRYYSPSYHIYRLYMSQNAQFSYSFHPIIGNVLKHTLDFVSFCVVYTCQMCKCHNTTLYNKCRSAFHAKHLWKLPAGTWLISMATDNTTAKNNAA